MTTTLLCLLTSGAYAQDDEDAGVDATVAATNPNSASVSAANDTRLAWLENGRNQLVALESALREGGEPDPTTLASVQSWMHLGVDQPTSELLQTAIRQIEASAAKTSAVTVHPDAVTVTCAKDPKVPGNPFACAEVGGDQVYLHKEWVDQAARPVCQATVLTHEALHNVGLGHGDHFCKQPESPETNVRNADCLAGLLCELGGAAKCGAPCSP